MKIKIHYGTKFLLSFIIASIVLIALSYVIYLVGPSMPFYLLLVIYIIFLIVFMTGLNTVLKFVFTWAHVLEYNNTAPHLHITNDFIYERNNVKYKILYCKDGFEIIWKWDIPVCIIYNMKLESKNDIIAILDNCEFNKDHIYFDENKIPGKYWLYRVTYTNVK